MLEIVPAARTTLLPPYMFGALNALRDAKRAQGVDVIDLAMGNPTDPPPKRVVDRLVREARKAKSHRYEDNTGIPELKEAAAAVFNTRYGIRLDPPENLIVTIGSKEGLGHLCLGLLGPRDVMLIPEPTFPIHAYGARLAGARTAAYPVGGEKEMLAAIEKLMRRRKPKAVLLNFPHNPTATTVSLDFYEQVTRLARRHKVFVISDNAYGACYFDNAMPPSLMQTRHGMEVGVEFTTLSKEFSMAGWRVGFCYGHPEALRILAKIKGYYDYGFWKAIQLAAVVALTRCEAEAEAQRAVYQERRDALCGGLEKIGWEVAWPKASMFAWIRIPETYRTLDSMTFCMEATERAAVLIAPGSGFGPRGEGYLRMALIESAPRLRKAARRLKRAFPL
jgi:alanine-synthesizing transaminase